MIITIANSKGGVGKSTLAVHLAAWLHEQGCKVTLADCDTQQSSSEWIREAVPGVKAVRLDNPDIILNELPILGQDADFVVADGPGSQTETSRALLLRADLAIVPCKASMLEVRALANVMMPSLIRSRSISCRNQYSLFNTKLSRIWANLPRFTFTLKGSFEICSMVMRILCFASRSL